MLHLTTTDNPFSPIDDYDNWSKFDHDHGYNTDELVARIVGPIDFDLPEVIVNEAFDDAIKWLFEWNPTGNYSIVTE
nr:MAG TPA: hypothetical protein [Caudoviricetes sp.]